MKHAGVYHLATGTWTRGSSLENDLGQHVIYNNTCVSGFFSDQLQNERYQHGSRIPSPSGPTNPSWFGLAGNDEAPGCKTSYVVSGFQFAYCSSSPTTVDWLLEFADSWHTCSADMVPTHSFAVTGLPGGTASGGQNCWIVDVDLAGGGLSFVAQADGDGTYIGPSQIETFGWSWSPTSAVTGTFTGPIIAGDYSLCTGTDGTIWDSPINLVEQGTGMASNYFFRIASGPTGAPAGPGCYWGGAHYDFHLKLYSTPSSTECAPMVSFCHPGLEGVRDCPCDNPPSQPGRGCNNSSATGGALLSASGMAKFSYDTVVLTTSGQKPASLSIVLQGNALLSSGAIFGQGVRCMGGSLLKRLYVKQAAGGAITAPQPGDPSVSTRSAALGDSIPPGATRYYTVYYRDPIVPGGCPASSTFNSTQGGVLVWNP